MTSLLNNLEDHLNFLGLFLEMSREEFFEKLKEYKSEWFPENYNTNPDLYTAYRKHVNHSVFLLGFSYFENFMVDLLKNILQARPNMLSNDKSLRYSDIISLQPDSHLDAVLEIMIKKEVNDLFYKNMKEIIEEIRKRYQLTIPDDVKQSLYIASLYRNCIIHNSSRADEKLSREAGININAEFELSTDQIHRYGWIFRDIDPKIYNEANEKHLAHN